MLKIVLFAGILLPLLVQCQILDQQYEGRRGLRANPNHGVIKSLEARILALERTIQEYQDKEVLLQERSEALELRSLELTKVSRENERRIQQRQDALDKREAEITAYQNQVFKDQDLREREIERLGREKERVLDQRLRSIENAERNL